MAAGVAWHLFLCGVSLRVVRALRVRGTRRPLFPGTCPCALVVAGGVPLWRASWPRVVRRASSGPVALGAPVGFPDSGAFPHPGGLHPRLYWVAARGTRRPAKNLTHCACHWPPPRQGRWARSASYPFGAPRWGCPWRVPPASVLGCVRCGGWRVWTWSLTRLVSCTVCCSTGDSAGAPGLFRVDADTSPCGSEDATAGSRACVRVLALFGRVGRAGLPGAFWCSSTFPLAALSFCFAWPPQVWGCPRPGPLLLFCFFLFFFLFLRCFFSFFFPCAPFVSCFLWLPALGALGLGAWCCLFCWPQASWLSVRSRSLCVAWPLAALWWLPPPPPSLSLLLPFLVALRLFFFHFFSSSSRPPCLWLSVFSGPGCPGPWRWFVFVVLGSLCPVFVFFCPPPLGSSCAVACFVSPGWLLVFPESLLPPPPSPSVFRGFSSFPLGALVFFSSLFVRPRCLRLSLVSGPGCPGPWRCVLFVFLGLPLPGSRCAFASFVSPAWPLAALWWLLPPPPPPPLLCLAVFVAPAGCLGVFFSSSSVRPRLGLPLLGSPCAFPSFVLSARSLAAPWWLLPPLCVSRFSSLPLGAVWRVLCCAVSPWVRCCAALLRVVSPGVVLSCAVLLCCARLVPLVVAPCPLALPVALGPCALRRCVLRCSLALCALCCLCFVVARWCVLLVAALLCAVCVPGCCAVRSLSSPLCAVLCFAVLVRSCCAVRVVLAVAGAWCCGALLGHLGLSEAFWRNSTRPHRASRS